MRHVAFTLLSSQAVIVNVCLGFSIDKQCGKTICSAYEYCSIFNEQCEKCSDICNENTHNYDEKHCRSYCRDFLAHNNFEGEINELKRNQTITLILLGILIVFMIIQYGLRIIAWSRKTQSLSTCISSRVKMNKTTATNLEATITNTAPTIDGKVRTDGSQIISMSGIVQTVSTPISTRFPAENSTTEYSYDNAALQISPVGDKPNGPETTF